MRNPPCCSEKRTDQSLSLLRHAMTLILAIAMWHASGCTRSDSPSEDPSVQNVDGKTAQEYLQSVFMRYRSAQSYRDSGRVTLRYQIAGRQQSEEAPLRVWFDRNLLYVEAYDVRLKSDEDGVEAWFDDPETENFDSQVLTQASRSSRPQIDYLFADPVLNDRIAAGLAGPPPQLEWLFAEQPMKHLFDGEHVIQYGPVRLLHERECLTIDVQADGDHFLFWIDKTTSLIKRVDLPSIYLSPEHYAAVTAGDGEAFKLTLELDSATFESPKDQPALAKQPINPKLVGQFIPLPPAEPLSMLGSLPKKFSTRDQTGRIKFNTGRSDHEVTAILFADETDAGNYAAYSFAQWARMMPAKLEQRVRAILVTNELGFRRLTPDIQIPVVIDQNGKIREAMRSAQNDFFIFNREGRIQWTQSKLDTQPLAKTGVILSDVLDGVDVPSRLRDQWRSGVENYKSILGSEIARQKAK